VGILLGAAAVATLVVAGCVLWCTRDPYAAQRRRILSTPAPTRGTVSSQPMGGAGITVTGGTGIHGRKGGAGGGGGGRRGSADPTQITVLGGNGVLGGGSAALQGGLPASPPAMALDVEEPHDRLVHRGSGSTIAHGSGGDGMQPITSAPTWSSIVPLAPTSTSIAQVRLDDDACWQPPQHVPVWQPPAAAPVPDFLAKSASASAGGTVARIGLPQAPSPMTGGGGVVGPVYMPPSIAVAAALPRFAIA